MDMTKWKLSALIVSIVILFDQTSKFLIRSSLTLYEKVNVFPFFDVVHYRNRGAAFGILNDLNDDIRLLFFLSVFVVAVVVIVAFLYKLPEKSRLLTVALSMVLGGAVGNSIDRFRLGYVTDFLDLHWFDNPALHWAAFNLADSAISVGVALVLLDTIWVSRGR